MDYYGYAGRILRVDLSSGDVDVEPLDLDLASKFVGGEGFCLRAAQDLIKPELDPLAPDSPIIISGGPLIGTLAPCASKTAAVMKFPVHSGRKIKKHVVDTTLSGGPRFGAMLRYAGYDQVIITGRAKKPSYLKIIDDDIEICDAGELWGKADTYQTTDELSSRHRGSTGKAGVWAIGKGGENLLTSAAGMVDKMNFLGSFGGAVLGSKNLKAVVSLGSRGIKVADRKRFMAAVDGMRKKLITHPAFMTTMGEAFARAAEAGYPVDILDRGLVHRIACISCPDPCKSNHVLKDGKFKGEFMQFARAEHIVRFGYGLGMDLKDYSEGFMLFDMTNRAGVVLFSAMRMLHFVTRMFERGFISIKDTGGLMLKTGDFDSYVKLFHKYINREDIGEYMAQGWYALSEKTGVDASNEYFDGCAIVRGFDAIEDPRLNTFSPFYGVSGIVRPRGQFVMQDTQFPRGEDIHKDTYLPTVLRSLNDIKRDCTRFGMTPQETEKLFTNDSFNHGRLERHAEDCCAVCNSLGVCMIGGFGFQTRDVPWMKEAYSSLTGLETTTEEMKKKGERVYILKMLLNIREGFTRADEEVPSVWLQNIEKPFKRGNEDHYLTDWFERRITREEVYQMLDDYYDERGCDLITGIPKPEKLEELGLDNLV